ncbi:MAG: hypothetical protein MJ087_00465 [Lachnospiraceae bacterium]|nr:hypothetical protein [Lachnospiraceae bacterium]
MEDNKKNIIAPIVFLVVFLISMVIFNYVLVGTHSKSVAETSEAELPLLTVYAEDQQLSTLHGYIGDMDKSLLREAITPLETENAFDVVLSKNKEDIPSVSFNLYKNDNKTVLESGIASFRKEKKKTVTTIRFKERLETGKVYLAELILENKNSVSIRYYTRIKCGTELHFSECMEFIQKFHKQALAGGTEGIAYVSYFLEPKDSYQNNDLSKVDIHSNADVVCYASMKPKVEKNFNTKVTEISEDLSSVEMKTLLSFENSEGKKYYYMATENFKIRYSVSRMYLLDYERTMEEYFQYDSIDASKNRFRIGITGSNEKDLHTANDCELAAFVQADQLWLYDFQAGEMVSVFSFIGEDYRDLRNNYEANAIDIMNLDKKGNITYLVYGYMNRGEHEGENGICVYRFHAKDRVNEEVLFIPTAIPYEYMKQDMDALAYLDKNDYFYFFMDGSIYKVNPAIKEYEVLASGIRATDVVSSEKGYYAIAKKNVMTLYDMKEGREQTIKWSDINTLYPIGFIGSDFVYGIGYTSDIKTKSDGSKVTPMKKVLVVSPKLEERTSYEKSGVYVLSATTEGNIVKLQRAKETAMGYEKLVDDYIHFKEETTDKITFEYGYSSSIYNQLYMTFPTFVYVTSVPKLVTAKEKVTGNYKTISFEENEGRTSLCYVYAKGKMIGTYTSPKQAIKEAKKNAGVVVDAQQHYIWEKGVAKPYAKVPSVSIVKVKNKKDSFAGCMQMLLKLNADSTSLEELTKEKGSPMEILDKYFDGCGVNLSGCALEDLVYYISKGRPLITRLKNGKYVVLMSYNSTKIRYIDPVKGESIQADRVKIEKEIKASGNKYYSYTD